MSNTTRIADLPENITMQLSANTFVLPPKQSQQQQQPQQQQQQQQQQQYQQQDHGGLGQNAYMPINIHPNPFGPQANAGDMPLPQNVHESMDPFRASGQTQRLPSRDIPMDSTGYTQDEEIQPNYIPPPAAPTDYIRHYEETENKKLKKHEEEKYRKETAEDLITQLQTPLFVALLYFIFQMPVLNRLLYKYLAFLPIFKPDGNPNLYGMILKSGGFALMYYSMDKIVDYFSFL